MGETYCFSHSCPSVCLNIRLSVRHKSCPLNNSSKTLSGIFEAWYKYRAPSGDVQRTSTITSPALLTEWWVGKSCPLNLKPSEIFFNFAFKTNIKYYQAMCRSQLTTATPSSILTELCSFENFSREIVSA